MILPCSASGASAMTWSEPGSQMRITTARFSARMIEEQVERREAFLLEVEGTPVSLLHPHGAGLDIVQIGGVWTPTQWRGRG